MVKAGNGEVDEKMRGFHEHEAQFIYPAVSVSGLFLDS